MKKGNIFSTFDADFKRLKRDLLNPISSYNLKSAKILKGTGITSKKILKFDFSQAKLTSRLCSIKNLDSSHSIYPQWLLDRSDFKSLLDCSSQADLGRICKKPSKLRNSQETHDLLSWTKVVI